MKVGRDKTIHSAVIACPAIVTKDGGRIKERRISLNYISDPRPVFIQAVGRLICIIGGRHGREYCVDANVGELPQAAISCNPLVHEAMSNFCNLMTQRLIGRNVTLHESRLMCFATRGGV